MTEAPAYSFESATWEHDPGPAAGSGDGSTYAGVAYRQWLHNELDQYNNPMKIQVAIRRDSEGNIIKEDRQFRTYRFFSDPGDAGVANGHWFNVEHQVDAGNGLIDICEGSDMPPGCKSIPMMGWDDPVIDRVRPHKYNTNERTGKVRPTPVALGLFVDELGETRILEMSKAQYTKFIDEVAKIRRYTRNPEFSIAGLPVHVYKAGAKGKPGASTIAIDLLDEAETDLPALEPDEFPVPIDLKAHLVEIREKIADLIVAKTGGQVGEVRVTEDVQPSMLETHVTSAEADKADDVAIGLGEYTATQLRNILTQAGIPFAKGSRRPTLEKLIVDNGVDPTDFDEDQVAEDPPF